MAIYQSNFTNESFLFETDVVAVQDFPDGGANSRVWGINPLIDNIFAENS